MAENAQSVAAIDGGFGLLGRLLGGLIQSSGQRKANEENRWLAQTQQNWNMQQWDKEQNQNQSNWEQQNQQNLEIWRRQNKYNEGRWDTENTYNEQRWEIQNKYNSPQQQMARLKEAGLSPHLMYGKGSTGQAPSMATGNMRASLQQANGLKSPDTKGYSRANAESVTKGMDIFGGYNDWKNLQAQTNNTEAQTDVLKEEALLKAQNRLIGAISLGHKDLDYGIAKDLRETSVNAAKASLENLQQSVRRNAAEANISVNTQDPRIREAEQRVKNLVQQYKGQELTQKLQRESLKLRQYGVTEADNVILRMVMKYQTELNKIFQNKGK